MYNGWQSVIPAVVCGPLEDPQRVFCRDEKQRLVQFIQQSPFPASEHQPEGSKAMMAFT